MRGRSLCRGADTLVRGEKGGQGCLPHGEKPKSKPCSPRRTQKARRRQGEGELLSPQSTQRAQRKDNRNPFNRQERKGRKGRLFTSGGVPTVSGRRISALRTGIRKRNRAAAPPCPVIAIPRSPL